MKNCLLASAREGDEEAEKKIFQYLLVRFKTFATRRIGKTDAEDVAQEACLTVLQKYKDETFTKGFQPWAYGVLKMTIRNYMRGPLHREKKLAPEFKIDQSMKVLSLEPDYELKRKLLNCLKQIYKRNRLYARVLNFKHQGYKTDDICQRLQIKPRYYYVILNRGRKLLSICLEKGRI